MRSLGSLKLFLVLVLASCRYVTKEEIEISEHQPYRCGRYESRIYVRSPIVEEYPDLGVILANAHTLQLSSQEKAQIEEKARECYAICQAQLDQIRLLEDDLKSRIALNEMKGDMSAVAKDLNTIEQEKQLWLQQHRKCYYEGLQLLSGQSLARWLPHESKFKPLKSYEKTK